MLAFSILFSLELMEPCKSWNSGRKTKHVAAAAAKSLQSCPTLCDPLDGSPPGFPVPGILQARTLEWVAISFSIHVAVAMQLCEYNKNIDLYTLNVWVVWYVKYISVQILQKESKVRKSFSFLFLVRVFSCECNEMMESLLLYRTNVIFLNLNFNVSFICEG